MPIRLGGHGLSVDSDDPVALARAHREFGYGAAYVPVSLLGADAQTLAAWERAFAAEDVMLAEVGIWRNLIDPDPAKRRAELDYAAQWLSRADAAGARCAVSFIGSFATGTRYGLDPRNLGPEALEAAVETARYLIDTVKPKRAKFALEMMQATIPDSADSYLELISAVDRPAFAAHLDPVNLVMTPRTYFDTGALIRECFAKLGPWIVSCHAKDITLHETAALHLDEVQIGEGNLDYRTYLTQLSRLPDVPLLLEHLKPEEYALGRDRIFAVGDAVGVGFVHRR
ncbi:MAG: sugar phosphate isomerase/epimerase family protein [Devosia sp.]